MHAVQNAFIWCDLSEKLLNKPTVASALGKLKATTNYAACIYRGYIHTKPPLCARYSDPIDMPPRLFETMLTEIRGGSADTESLHDGILSSLPSNSQLSLLQFAHHYTRKIQSES